MAYDPHTEYRGDKYLYSGIMQGAGAAVQGVEQGVQKHELTAEKLDLLNGAAQYAYDQGQMTSDELDDFMSGNMGYKQSAVTDLMAKASLSQKLQLAAAKSSGSGPLGVDATPQPVDLDGDGIPDKVALPTSRKSVQYFDVPGAGGAAETPDGYVRTIVGGRERLVRKPAAGLGLAQPPSREGTVAPTGPTSAVGATQPVTATGPGGKKLQLVNGQWTPMQ